jgi:hypothetical protein
LPYPLTTLRVSALLLQLTYLTAVFKLFAGATPGEAAGIRVDLFVWNGQQWVNWSYAITGDDGFYYFVNVQPGATFCIQVGGKYYPPHPEKISDTAPPNYQDIQPVVI